jgi:hypothetical protein
LPSAQAAVNVAATNRFGELTDFGADEARAAYFPQRPDVEIAGAQGGYTGTTATTWAGTAKTVRARRGEPTARIAGPPGELLLYLFGRQGVAHVEVSGPAAAAEAVRRARFGM